MKKTAFVVMALLIVSCGMKSALVAPEKVTKPTVQDEYWMAGKEEGDFVGVSPLPSDESCVEIIKGAGPLQKASEQQDTSQDEGQQTEQKSEPENSDDDATDSD